MRRIAEIGIGWLVGLMLLPGALAADVYFNDFNASPGTSYPEWTSTFAKPPVNVESPNGKQRFLGEFGGPMMVTGRPFVRVDETVTLTLRNLRAHATATVSFDLYVLKSWDGNNPIYGPDKWRLSVAGGMTLLDTTFSNNFKTGVDLSLQNFPVADSAPQTSATAVNSMGYKFFGDSTYHLTYMFPHDGDSLVLSFSSSLFEGKGTADESWGLDNVLVSTH